MPFWEQKVKFKINCKIFSLLVLGIDLMVLRMLSKTLPLTNMLNFLKKKNISLNFDTGFYLVIQAGLEVTP